MKSYFQVFGDGEWSQAAVNKHSFSKIVKVKVNPEVKLEVMTGVDQFTAYLDCQVKPRPVKELLQSSDVVGNIRFSRPTLYIFPGAHGDSALFGISGFNLLVNGGYNRKACFWDFTRHLDRIDAMLYTHLGPDNLFGLSSVLERKAQENVHPEIGFIYMNAVEKNKNSPNGDLQPENGGSHKSASLSVSLVEEGNRMVEHMRILGQVPHPCTGQVQGQALQPINLYHKVGHGTLDMYVLNPFTDSKELKEFFAQWNKNVNNFSSKGGISTSHLASVCALLVWRPSSPAEKITRILFPGSCPQPKVFEGLDKVKTMDIFQHSVCSEKSLATAKPAGAKKPGAAGKAGPGKSVPAAKVPPTPRSAAPKAAPATKAAAPKAKTTKEASNTKKLAATKAASPASSKASSKAGSKASTPKSTTPAETPKEVASPEKPMSPAPPVADLVGPINGLEESKPVEDAIPPAQVEEPIKSEPVAEVAAPKEEPLIETLPPSEPPVTESDPEAGLPPAPPSDPMTTSFIDMDTMGESSEPEGQAPAEPVPEASGVPEPEPVAPSSEPEPSQVEPDLIQPAAAVDVKSMPESDQAPVDVIPQDQATPTEDNQVGLGDATNAPEAGLGSPDGLPEPGRDPMTDSFMEGLGQNPITEATPEKSIESELPEAHIDAPVEPKLPVCTKGPEPEVITEQCPPELDLTAEPKPEAAECSADVQDVQLEEKVEQEEAPVEESKPEAETVPDVIPDAEFTADPKPDAAECQEKEAGDLMEKTEEKGEQKVEDVKQEEKADVVEGEEAKPEVNSVAESEGDQQVPDAGVPDAKTLEDLGIFDADSPPAPEAATPNAEPAETPQALPDPEQDMESDVTAMPGKIEETAASPSEAKSPSEAEQMVFNGEPPEGLPEPEEPDPCMLDSDLPQVHMELQKPHSPEVEECDFLPQEVIGQGHTPERSESGEDEQVVCRSEVMEHEQGQPVLSEPTDDSMTPEVSPCEEDRPQSPLEAEVAALEPEQEVPQEVEVPQSQEVEVPQSESPPQDSATIPAALTPESEPSQSQGHVSEGQEVTGQCEGHEVMLSGAESEGECDGSDVSGGLTADDLAQCPEPQQPIEIPGLDPDSSAMEQDSLMQEPSEVEGSQSAGMEPSGEAPLLDFHDGPDAAHPLLDAASVSAANSNPFLGIDGANSHPTDQSNIPESEPINGLSQAEGEVMTFDPKERDSIEHDLIDRDSLEKEVAAPKSPEPCDRKSPEDEKEVEFDPLKDWGQPMGLPAPASPKKGTGAAKKDPAKAWGKPQGLPAPPPDATAEKKGAAAKKDPAAARKPGVGAAKKPASAAKKDLSKTAPATSRTAPAKRVSDATSKGPVKKPASAGAKPANGVAAKKDDKAKNGPAEGVSAVKKTAAATRKAATSRPATAPEKAAPKAAAAKRPATSTARASPAAQAKPTPPQPVTPFYVDLTYVPCHGNSSYLDWDFFRRVRARYYVVSALNPSPAVFTALLDAKQTWENPDLEVTIIPTYDTETLRHWMGLHRDQLAQWKIDVAPSASRCTIQLQDHETSCAAFRLEF